MGYAKAQLLEELDSSDKLHLECSRCGSPNPYDEMFDSHNLLSKEEAIEIANSDEDQFILCSWCEHMATKDD